MVGRAEAEKHISQKSLSGNYGKCIREDVDDDDDGETREEKKVKWKFILDFPLSLIT